MREIEAVKIDLDQSEAREIGVGQRENVPTRNLNCYLLCVSALKNFTRRDDVRTVDPFRFRNLHIVGVAAA